MKLFGFEPVKRFFQDLLHSMASSFLKLINRSLLSGLFYFLSAKMVLVLIACEQKFGGAQKS